MFVWAMLTLNRHWYIKINFKCKRITAVEPFFKAECSFYVFLKFQWSAIFHGISLFPITFCVMFLKYIFSRVWLNDVFTFFHEWIRLNLNFFSSWFMNDRFVFLLWFRLRRSCTILVPGSSLVQRSSFVQFNLFYPVCEDHDQSWFQDHVVAHVRVVAGHHDHGLLVWNSSTDVLKQREIFIKTNWHSS
jgi:hypothetical protein